MSAKIHPSDRFLIEAEARRIEALETTGRARLANYRWASVLRGMVSA